MMFLSSKHRNSAISFLLGGLSVSLLYTFLNIHYPKELPQIKAKNVVGTHDSYLILQGKSEQSLVSARNALKINVNQASREDLETLSGIGPAFSLRIIENRPYTGLNDLKEKTKIRDSVLESLASSIDF